MGVGVCFAVVVVTVAEPEEGLAVAVPKDDNEGFAEPREMTRSR